MWPFIFMPDKLREFADVHIGEDCRELQHTYHDNELFFECMFEKLNGLVLKDCDLNYSRFLTNRVCDALGFTLTLDCNSFKNVEYSELLFDLMLALLASTKGNDGKREKLVSVIGHSRYQALKKLIEVVE